MALSTGVRVNAAVALRCPVGIVRVASTALAAPSVTVRVTTVSADSGPPSSMPVTVRRLAPPFSATLSGDTVSVMPVDGVADGSSSSAMFRVCSDGCAIPCVLVATPETSTSRSGWSMVLSLAVTVTVPVLSVAPAAIRRTLFELSVKSFPSAASTGAAETAITVSSLEARSSFAITVLFPPFSGIEAGVRTSVACGVSSLSLIVTVAGFTVSPVAVPRTVTVSSGSSMLSSTGISVNVSAPLAAFAGIVIVKAGTAPKSVPAVAVPPATEIRTAVSVLCTPPSSVAVAVTVRALPVASSATSSGDTVRVIPVADTSSSLMVSVCGAGPVDPCVFVTMPETVTLLTPSTTLLLFAALIVTVPVLSVAPSAIVRVVPVKEKSAAAVFVPAAAETVIVVSSLDGRSSVAVTVLLPPFSEIEAGVSTRLTCGAGSLSRIVTLNPAAGRTDSPDTAVVPLIRTVSSGSSMSSFTGVNVNVPVALVMPVAIVIVKSVTAEKSVVSAAVPASTETATSVSSLRTDPFSDAVTVTVVPSAPSGTLTGITLSVTVAGSFIAVTLTVIV